MIKFIAIALILGVLIVYIRSINSELTALTIIASGVILLSFSLTYIAEIYNFVNKILEMASISSEYVKIIFKITAIGYLIEFGAGILEDFNLKSLGDKLVFLGKIIILATSLPIIYGVINLIISFIN